MFDESFGAGADAGGGFDSPSSKGGGGGGKASMRGAEPLLPVTCEMLSSDLRSDDDKMSIGAKQFSHVVFVGEVVETAMGETSFDFKITDDGGKNTVGVRAFRDDQNEQNYQSFMEGDLVRVFGRLRSFDGQQTLIAFRILPLAMGESIKSHGVEVDYARLFWEKDIYGRATRGGKEAEVFNDMAEFANPADYVKPTPNLFTTNMEGLVGGDKPAVGATMSSKTDEQRVEDTIQRMSQASTSENGFTPRDVHEQITEISYADVMKHLYKLMQNGHVYDTLGEEDNNQENARYLHVNHGAA